MLDSSIIDALTTNHLSQINNSINDIKFVLDYLGKPQDKFKTIHITGTNGKGSTAAFIESALIFEKYKVGKFSTPHIYKINETISLNNRYITDDNLTSYYKTLEALLRIIQISLSPFELLVVIMFMYFADHNIDFLVLEVGMGGLNDATNVIACPIVVVITNIGLEHTKFLGDTLKSIACQKSAIIKGSYTVFADNKLELLNAIKVHTKNYCNILKKYNVTVELDFNAHVTVLNFNNNKYNLKLFGLHQSNNFLCAYEVMKYLHLSENAIKFAADNTQLIGRMTFRFIKNQLILFDVTHNADGAYVLFNTLSKHYKENDIVIITSILKDKNLKEIFSYFNQLAKNIIITSINADRGLKAYELYTNLSLLKALNKQNNYFIIDSVKQALDCALQQQKKLIVITGSFLLLKEIETK